MEVTVTRIESKVFDNPIIESWDSNLEDNGFTTTLTTKKNCPEPGQVLSLQTIFFVSLKCLENIQDVNIHNLTHRKQSCNRQIIFNIIIWYSLKFLFGNSCSYKFRINKKYKIKIY